MAVTAVTAVMAKFVVSVAISYSKDGKRDVLLLDFAGIHLDAMSCPTVLARTAWFLGSNGSQTHTGTQS